MRNTVNLLVEKIFHKYFLFRSFFTVTLFFIAFICFLPLINGNNDWFKLIIVLYGIIVISLIVLLMFEYLIKLMQIQINKEIKTYSIISAINNLFGLIVPLIYINFIVLYIMKALGLMQNFGTIICKLRLTVTDIYFQNHTYYSFNQIIYIILILNIILFIFGPFIEQLHTKHLLKKD